MFCQILGSITAPAVHHPVLHSRSLCFKHEQVAHQGLLWSRSNQGRIVVLHTQKTRKTDIQINASHQRFFK